MNGWMRTDAARAAEIRVMDFFDFNKSIET